MFLPPIYQFPFCDGSHCLSLRSLSPLLSLCSTLTHRQKSMLAFSRGACRVLGGCAPHYWDPPPFPSASHTDYTVLRSFLRFWVIRAGLLRQAVTMKEWSYTLKTFYFCFKYKNAHSFTITLVWKGPSGGLLVLSPGPSWAVVAPLWLIPWHQMVVLYAKLPDWVSVGVSLCTGLEWAQRPIFADLGGGSTVSLGLATATPLRHPLPLQGTRM